MIPEFIVLNADMISINMTPLSCLDLIASCVARSAINNCRGVDSDDDGVERIPLCHSIFFRQFIHFFQVHIALFLRDVGSDGPGPDAATDEMIIMQKRALGCVVHSVLR